MKKLLFVALLLLPVIALGQVKRGMTISEVVRRAQAEVEAAEGKGTKEKRQKTPKRSHRNSNIYNPNYNQYSAGTVGTGANSLSYSDYYDNQESRQKRVREPRAKPDRSEWNNQFDFRREFGISISTNALQWLTATPNAAVTFQYDKFSLLAEGAYAFWDMPNYNYWRLLSVGAELRYDIMPRLYVGLMYSWSDYNFKISESGNQGALHSFGAIVGYKLPVSNRCYFDFGVGVGYALIENEKYHHSDGNFVRDKQRGFGYWGPLKAKASFSWRIF